VTSKLTDAQLHAIAARALPDAIDSPLESADGQSAAR
jgi:hypothetical protein